MTYTRDEIKGLTAQFNTCLNTNISKAKQQMFDGFPKKHEKLVRKLQAGFLDAGNSQAKNLEQNIKKTAGTILQLVNNHLTRLDRVLKDMLIKEQHVNTVENMLANLDPAVMMDLLMSQVAPAHEELRKDVQTNKTEAREIYEGVQNIIKYTNVLEGQLRQLFSLGEDELAVNVSTLKEFVDEAEKFIAYSLKSIYDIINAYSIQHPDLKALVNHVLPTAEQKKFQDIFARKTMR